MLYRTFAAMAVSVFKVAWPVHLPLALVDNIPRRFEPTRQGPEPNVVHIQALSDVDFLLHLSNERPKLATRRSRRGSVD